jgi:hypothetical protein
LALVLGLAAAGSGSVAGPALAQAPAASPSPAQVALARDLVLSTGMSRSFNAIIPQYADQINVTITRTRPELTKDLKDVLLALRPEFEAQTNEMVDAAARIYAARMTEPELKDSLNYFHSASGKKYVQMQPFVLDELLVAMQAWSQKVSTNMMQRVREEMKKKGFDL